MTISLVRLAFKHIIQMSGYIMFECIEYYVMVMMLLINLDIQSWEGQHYKQTALKLRKIYEDNINNKHSLLRSADRVKTLY